MSSRSVGSRIADHLFGQVAIDFLVVYRIAFGFCTAWWASRYVLDDLAFHYFVLPPFHFSYYGFSWIKPIEFQFTMGDTVIHGMTLLFLAMTVLAVFVMIGLWYRVSAALLGIAVPYVFLLDQSHYLNHYYLMSILAFVMPFFPAHRAFSLDAYLRPRIRSSTVPGWILWWLRFQIGVPYFFGGISKINSDWMQGQPVRMAFNNMASQGHPVLSQWPLPMEYLVQFIGWGGMLFDLAIVPLLLWRRTRLFAFLVALTFHVTNANIFTIGVFPWLMAAATTIYFAPDWPRRLLARLRVLKPSAVQTSVPLVRTPQWLRVGGTSVFLLWITVQSLIPLRCFVLDTNPSWTEYCHNFSWHMMLRGKLCGLLVFATDPTSGKTGTIDLRPYITVKQLKAVARDPKMIQQFCMFIEEDLRSKGYPDLEMRVMAMVALNGRKAQLMIDPYVDLTAVPRDMSYPEWLLELKEPYRHEAWIHPLSEWQQLVEMDIPASMRAAIQPRQQVSEAETPANP